VKRTPRQAAGHPATAGRLGEGWVKGESENRKEDGMSVKELSAGLQAKGLRVGIVVSRFNDFLTKQLLSGAVDCLVRHGAAEENITVVWVPGANECPLAVQKLAQAGKHDALVALGAVIQGATPHAELINSQVSRSLAALAMNFNVPIVNGIVAADNLEQAIERCGTKAGNKGWQAAQAVRRHAREWAVQLLFQLDMNPGPVDAALEEFWSDPERKADAPSRAFTEGLVRGVGKHRVKIDRTIRKCAEHWDLSRMGVLDRNVLRLGAYEILFCKDVPPAVAINEAVDLAKYFSDTKSGKFVNGILDRVRRDLDRPPARRRKREKDA
jgi:6,7-dimethyl-8-ribityllumazine synthase